MKKRPLLSLALIPHLLATTFGQNPAPPAPASQQHQQQGAPAEEEEVVRITTNLVQVDAVVTDKSGRPVTDLRPEEFEILEDGKPQKITNFSYISTETAPARQPVAGAATPVDKNGPPVPPTRLRPGQVRRTIALVVDDLGLSFESTYYVRQALKKFVDRQMQQGDLVAIIRTGGGIGALQQFTSDKRQLYAAIERVRWNPSGRGGISAFAPIEANPVTRSSVNGDDRSDTTGRSAGDELNNFREDLFTVGTLGALNFIVRGLRELPGRKSILLISDGFPLLRLETGALGLSPGAAAGIRGGAPPRTGRTTPGALERSERVIEALHRLTDLANRASVVIYTMDARGLQTLGLTAADNTAGLTPDQLEAELSDRRSSFYESQSGLIYLAQQTGGFAIRNNNDLAGGIHRVIEDQKGYYLIGYRPDESTFDSTGRRRFHRVAVKVKRLGLRVRSRTGFYGITDEEAHPAPRTPGEELMSALTSPFASGSVHLRLTSFFGNDPKEGSYVRSLLSIDPHDLTFKKDADGRQRASFDVLAITFGDNGRVVDQVGRTYTLSAPPEAYQRALRDGFVYYLKVPIKKAGAYQLRTALRDTASARVGSASQFIEVPEINKNRLALSGLVVSGMTLPAAGKSSNKQSTDRASTGATPSPAPAQNSEDGTGDAEDAQAGPAVRRFHHGMAMRYGYVIFNAQQDRTTRRPQLQTQVRLFRDAQQVFAGKLLPFDPGNQTDLKRLVAGGALQLGTGMQPGEYVLQVVVVDTLAREKYRTATQWIDFEIIK